MISWLCYDTEWCHCKRLNLTLSLEPGAGFHFKPVWSNMETQIVGVGIILLVIIAINLCRAGVLGPRGTILTSLDTVSTCRNCFEGLQAGKHLTCYANHI